MKEKAIELRKHGCSIKEIARSIGKGVSTVHLWVKDVSISEDVKKELASRGSKAANKKLIAERKERVKKLGFKKIESTIGTGKYDPKGIGDRSEARITAEFMDAGLYVLVPFGDRNRYDIVIDENGTFIRVQCKTARLMRDKFVFKTESNNWNTGTRKSYKGDIDVFAVFLRENKKVYIFNVKNVPKGYCSVRLTEDRSNHGKRFASEHEFIPGKSLLNYK
jgi:hypothetical protein